LQAFKKIPKAIIDEENKLNKELLKLFKKPFKKIMDKLKGMENVPSSDMEMKILLSDLADIAEDFGNILFNNKQETLNYARAKTISEIEKAKKKAKKAKKIPKAISGISFMDYSPELLRLIKEKTFVASQHTLDRIIGDIMENLSESYQEGLGIVKAADNLKEVFDSMEDYQLKRIARTEINGAQNEGAFLTEQELELEYDQWWSAGDSRVRGTDPKDTADHVYMHGQIARVGKPFSNGLTYPGDRTGDISEWINCRCRLVPFFIPEGYRAPDMDYFYEWDLIKVE